MGVAALALPAVLPSTAWALDPVRTRATNSSWPSGSHAQHERLARLSSTIGPASEVAYLAYGGAGYHMGNPVRCNYPSPVFLKVGVRRERVTETPSYADTLECFTRTDAAWLIVQPAWLSIEQLPAEAQEALEERFDCTRAVTDGAGTIACPARAAAR